MKKYNIIYENPSIPDSEIEAHMDFKRTILKKNRYILKSHLRSYLKICIFPICIVSFVLTMYYWSNSASSSLIQKSLTVSATKVHPKTQTKKVQGPVSNPVTNEQKKHVNNKPALGNDQTKTKALSTTKAGSDITENFVEASPQGSYAELYEYFTNNLEYPEQAKKDSVTGTVLVEFIVNDKGTIDKIKIVKGLTAEMDEEAKRLITQMPRWNPASINGKYVSTKLTLPLSFSLENN